MTARLFVYGTLRRGFPAHGMLAARASPAGRARTRGRLYDTGPYPAAVPAAPEEDAWIAGELWHLAAPAEAALAALDAYEGFRPDAPDLSLFRRAAVPVQREDGGAETAWIYWFGGPVDAFVRIPSGDYAARDG